MWTQLLSCQRIGSSRPAVERSASSRSEFHKDYDRIIFSSAFRRLSDKTQVVPFPESDYTRQRLTHSLEVSCVGRSLATSVYDLVQHDVAGLVTQGDFEAIVAAACLAHDIGNPPFGHFGERAIQDWAKSWLADSSATELSPAERADLEQFEGNAQSFRVLTRLQMSNRQGGMRLTAATLGALVKYPRPSIVAGQPRYRKHGCVQDDRELFQEVFLHSGRQPDDSGQYARHPLALLSEAADDICYAIIDLEDGCRAGLIPIDAALQILEDLRTGSTGSAAMPDVERLSMGRAMVIDSLVGQCTDVFREHLDAILAGSFQGSLVGRTVSKPAYDLAKQTALERVFNSERVLELEAGGYRAIQGLLTILTTAVMSDSPSGFDQHVLKLTHPAVHEQMSLYQRLLACTDVVSGMTDRHCVDLYRKLSGHAV
ncbi:MAG: dNTP triphosphohydrolase [Planctomycetaceae bacterium]